MIAFFLRLYSGDVRSANRTSGIPAFKGPESKDRDQGQNHTTRPRLGTHMKALPCSPEKT